MISICEEQYLNENFLGDYFSNKWDTIKKRLNETVNKTNKKINVIEKKLKENGIDPGKIKKYVVSHKNELKIKNKKVEGFQGKINHFVKLLYERKFSSDTADFSRKIGISIVLLAVVLFINTAFLNLGIILGLPPQVALTISAIFCAPLTEETAKMISVKEGATGTYFIIFNVAEFSLYVSQMLAIGLPLLPVLIARSIAVLMHYIWTTIHVKAAKENKQKEGWIIAVLLHALWNTVASIK